MKRMIAILLAVLMLTGLLTACSGMVGMEDGRAYGNVSTTPNGTVNGGYRNSTNGRTDGYRNYDSYAPGTGMTGGR